MKILIFGLGRGLDYIEKHILPKHEIVAYSDSSTDIPIFHGRPFYRYEELPKIKKDIDYCIIAIKNPKEIKVVYDRLLFIFDKKRIVPFYFWTNNELWKYRLSQENNKEQVEGVVLGNSFSALGIRVDYLSKRFLNFAVPAQDIYGVCMTLRKIIKSLKNLKYVWIDLYDYNYFNYDVSRADYYIKEILAGGLVEKHNFDLNTSYSCNFEDFLLTEAGLDYKSDKSIMKDLFDEYLACDLSAYSDAYDKFCDEIVQAKDLMVLKKRHKKTIIENYKLLTDILELLKNEYPSIKTIFTLLPQYSSFEKISKQFLNEWEHEFESKINDICETYHVLYRNYKGYKGISDNRELFRDIRHLNSIGAKCMTSIIDADFCKILY